MEKSLVDRQIPPTWGYRLLGTHHGANRPCIDSARAIVGHNGAAYGGNRGSKASQSGDGVTHDALCWEKASVECGVWSAVASKGC